MGADLLIGGLSADNLNGGEGLDTFRYFSSAEGGDLISSYVLADDVIEVSAAGFGGGLAQGMDLATLGSFVSNTNGISTAAAGTGQFIFDTDDRRLLWDADGLGATGATVIATFATPIAFTASELTVIA